MKKTKSNTLVLNFFFSIFQFSKGNWNVTTLTFNFHFCKKMNAHVSTRILHVFKNFLSSDEKALTIHNALIRLKRLFTYIR